MPERRRDRPVREDLEEREEEEWCRGRPLGPYHGIDSLVLDRSADNPPANRPGYGGDYRLYQYIHRGIHSLVGGYRFHHLKRRYSADYAELRAEREGEFYEQRQICREV